MLTLLSPAKSLDFDTPAATSKSSTPRWMAESALLVEEMARRSPEALERMMKISPELALLNHERFQDWVIDPVPGQVRQAVLAFNGDVYRGLDAPTFTQRDFTHAQKHLRILSGLHGILRPLDLIQPYRLEMGSRLANPRGNDLYDFWSKIVTESLAEDLEGRSPKVVVNLASQEYANVVDRAALTAPMLTPRFLDWKNGEYKVISFFAKRARGLMARWIITDRITSIRRLRDFAAEGYRYEPSLSDRLHPAYLRDGR